MGCKYITKGGLVRETAYLYDDEERALEERAARDRCSKSEVIRRALRLFLELQTQSGRGDEKSYEEAMASALASQPSHINDSDAYPAREILYERR